MKITELILFLENLREGEDDLQVVYDADGFLLNLSEQSLMVREVDKEEFAYKPLGFTGKAVVIQ